MELNEFLKMFNAKESEIIEFVSEKEAIAAVKQNADALQYVNKKVFVK